MAELKGTNISAPIKPFTSEDVYATHEAQYGKGGFRSVAAFDDLRLIPQERLEEGMIAWAKAEKTTYQYVDGNWQEYSTSLKVSTKADLENISAATGTLAFVEDSKELYIYSGPVEKWKLLDTDLDRAGLNIYTPEQIEKLGDKAPSDYIVLDSTKEVDNKSNLEILFSSIRALQAEVTKLKNSFYFGINSCTNNETASSRMMYDLDDVEEEEPLWAVQESELSSLFSLQFTEQNELEPVEGASCSITVGPNNNYLEVLGSARYTCDEAITKSPDAKLFFYNNVNFVDDHGDSRFTLNDEVQISIKEALQSSYTPGKTYACLAIISRKVESKAKKGEYYGQNFIWLCIQELVNNNTVFEGYLDIDEEGEIVYFDISGKPFYKPVYLDDIYYFSSIDQVNLKTSKFDFYSKYQDFSDHVEAVRPSDLEDIKYKAAHITIRSISSIEELNKIVKQLQTNELVYVMENQSLYIIYGGEKHKIGGNSGGKDTDTMTVEELIKNLSDQGIITLKDAKYDLNGNLTSLSDIEISKIASLSMINESTGETVTFTVDSSGELSGNIETTDNMKFSYIVNGDYAKPGAEPSVVPVNGNINNLSGVDSDEITLSASRGFIARVHGDNVSGTNTDQRLNSDRIKIGAFFAPLSSSVINGCSHSYVELENTSETDYYLDDCYLHYAGAIIGKDGSGNEVVTQATYHIALSGKIPAGGTYLIRGARCAESDSPTTYIDVKTYDKEWYITLDSVSFTQESGVDYSDNYGKLLSFTTIDNSPLDLVYGFALTYKHKDILSSTKLIGDDTNQVADNVTASMTVASCLIDSLNMFLLGTASGLAYWNVKKSATKTVYFAENPGNCIFKNTFELDPAKQAFQSYHKKDSSRLRGATASDNQIVELSKEYIQFPNSDDTYPVSMFTPKASFEKKNVTTDKSKLDNNKPNMVTVSFGIDQMTTRCFNWISVGDYDEYVWVRRSGSTDWEGRWQSYWGDSVDTGSITRKEFNQTVVFGDTIKTIREIVYANPKYKNIFPGCKINYTTHKCILNISLGIGEYEYVVGRSTSSGSPMPGHSSEVQKFTIYPSNYTPVIYQITDQQGFHWIEYQAWAAAAKAINKKIEADKASSNIIPILLNTGDMTQNGTRINEWYDYYQAGRCLFDHLEQMNIVGNNDLGNVDETSLGTGDDSGKSNPHFYNQCYCYEIPIEIDGSSVYTPIINGTYIPSLYYFNLPNNYCLIAGNSEITTIASGNLFGGKTDVDIYTGYTWRLNDDNTSDVTTVYTNLDSMTIDGLSANHYIYEVLYHWMDTNKSKKLIFACHEIPFTVITQSNLESSYAYSDRSISVAGDSTGLVGSHCNRPNYVKKSSKGEVKVRNKGTYWLSRLLENFGIKYCIGGHKHTYTCTWPIRENYYYKNSGGTLVSSLLNGPMTMPSTLRDDEVYFVMAGDEVVIAETGRDTMSSFGDNISNLTKFPIAPSSCFSGDNIKGNYASVEGKTFINSITKDTRSSDTYVIYFMLQATGFKLKSNKELPGTFQKFSQIIPKTDGSKPSKQQIYPMFAKITLDSNYDSGLNIQLVAINHIVPNNQTEVFNQQTVYNPTFGCMDEPVLMYFDNRTGESENLNIPYGKNDGTDCWRGAEGQSINLNI